jgi:hypothetical protein
MIVVDNRKQTLMKKHLTGIGVLLSAVIITCLTMITSCDDGPTLTKVERATKLLTQEGGTWSPTEASITMDGLDVTDEFFSGFSITFGEGTFTTSGTTPMWLDEDTWSFKDNTATVIVRGQDNKELTIVELTKTKLVLTLEWDQTTTVEEGGRKKSLPGTYQFVLTK